MKRILILILTAILCLAGCTKNVPAGPTNGYTAPTLPEFDKTQPPDHHLQAVFDGLKGKSFTASCGSGWQNELTLTPCDTAALRQLIPNENLVADFCQKSIMMVPSNDGTFSYQLTRMTVEEACALLCNRPLTEEETTTLSTYTEAIAELKISTDENHIFRELKLTVTLDQTPWILQIAIELN